MTDSNSSLHEYTYDKLYQLTEVNYPDRYIHDIVTYNYDALGNRKSVVNGGTTNYSRNSLNQYTSVGGQYYSYDINGNLIGDGTYIYYYDCENRLTDVNDNSTGNRVASYKYDFAGRRVKKIDYTISPVRYTLYLYDGDQIIGIYDGTSGNLLRKFYYGPGIDEPICMHRTIFDVNGFGFFYYHYDGLGSVVALTNDSKQVIETYEYDVYGQPTIWDMNSHQMIESSLVGNPYFFTGREYGVEAGLYYYRARYYHPGIGRFMSVDPLGTVLDVGFNGINFFIPSQQYIDGMNLYAYVGNCPITRTDPFGLFCFYLKIEVTSINFSSFRTTGICPPGTGKGAARSRIRRFVNREINIEDCPPCYHCKWGPTRRDSQSAHSEGKYTFRWGLGLFRCTIHATSDVHTSTITKTGSCVKD
jgi:RHS repeat-associated protein